jgi:hypothetical protein
MGPPHAGAARCILAAGAGMASPCPSAMIGAPETPQEPAP